MNAFCNGFMGTLGAIVCIVVVTAVAVWLGDAAIHSFLSNVNVVG